MPLLESSSLTTHRCPRKRASPQCQCAPTPSLTTELLLRKRRRRGSSLARMRPVPPRHLAPGRQPGSREAPCVSRWHCGNAAFAPGSRIHRVRDNPHPATKLLSQRILTPLRKQQAGTPPDLRRAAHRA